MATKRMRGKLVMAAKDRMPVFKPALYLENNQVPKKLIQARPGKMVTFQIKGKIQSKREEAGNRRAVAIEVQALSLPKKKKAVLKKRGGNEIG